MKSPIVFRGWFQQPKHIAMKFTAEIGVELYHARVGPPAAWGARAIGSRVGFSYIGEQSTPFVLRSQTELKFETQVRGWQVLDSSQSPPRVLERNDWYEDAKGSVFLSDSYREKLERERKEAAERRISEKKAEALEGNQG